MHNLLFSLILIVRMLYDVIIIGSGCAGYTAAIYTSRGNLKTLVLAGTKAGGQLMLTSGVENYPGFPEGVLGGDLMDKMREQAEKFGAEIIYEDAIRVELGKNPFRVSADKEYQGKSVIVATGASAKWLGLENEQRLIGRGVANCAVCDAAFFKDKYVLVVGGGDTAIEEAIFLTKFASRVTVVHRRDQLRASKIMQERAFKNKKIDFMWNSAVADILGDKRVDGAIVEDVNTKKQKKVACDGVFVAIGHEPNTKIFQGQLELDEKGYLVVKNDAFTNVRGVFAAGDVADYRYKQAVTAAGMGCKAALEAEKYLEELGD